MNVPNKIIVQTKSYVQIVTKMNLYISIYGCEVVESYLDCIPLKMIKADGKHIGAYIEAKICQEYKEEGITRHDLYESNERNSALLDARMMLCVLVHKYTKMSNVAISQLLNRSRHTAKRALQSFSELDPNIPVHAKILARYARLDALIGAYAAYQPKIK